VLNATLSWPARRYAVAQATTLELTVGATLPSYPNLLPPFSSPFLPVSLFPSISFHSAHSLHPATGCGDFCKLPQLGKNTNVLNIEPDAEMQKPSGIKRLWGRCLTNFWL